MNVYIARQPIFNSRRQVKAYQLLFKDGVQSLLSSSPYKNKSELIMGSHFNACITSLTDGRPALIHIPQELLISGVTKLFPKNEVMLDMNEDMDPSDDLLKAVKSLARDGYHFAYTDCVFVYEWDKFFPSCKAIKINLGQMPLSSIEDLIPSLREQNVKLLAQDIESYEDFNHCKRLGFDYYQGSFFCQPEMLVETEISANHAYILALYKEVMEEGFSYKVIQEYIEKDVSLTYKLFRYINSNVFCHDEEIHSIKQALAYMGEDNIKRFICLVATSHLGIDKPTELTKLCVVRAKFCELSARKLNLNSDFGFLAGLFSAIDAILDRPMSFILAALPFTVEVKDALLDHSGIYGKLLDLICYFERGQWLEFDILADALELNDKELAEFYGEGVKWSKALEDVCLQAKSV